MFKLKGVKVSEDDLNANNINLVKLSDHTKEKKIHMFSKKILSDMHVLWSGTFLNQ